MTTSFSAFFTISEHFVVFFQNSYGKQLSSISVCIPQMQSLASPKLEKTEKSY